MNDSRREALLKEYGEVCNNFRVLTDSRFKLLAALPIATGIAAALLKGDGANPRSISLSIFGLVVTLGLATYNARNDQLYDELVARAAAIERSLGLPDGNFANRPRPWLSIRLANISWRVDHRTGIATIYAASIALWLVGLLAPLLEIVCRVELPAAFPHFVVANPSAWSNANAIVLAISLTYVGARWIKRQKKRRFKLLRADAADAVERAKGLDLPAAEKDDKLLALCSRLADEKVDTIKARAAFYASVNADSLSYYLPRDSKEQTAAHLVALLTDLPSQWLLDCLTNRRGRVTRP